MALGNIGDNEVSALGQSFTNTPTTISISGTSARNSSVLTTGRYRVVSDIDCYVKQGSSTITSTTSMSFLPAGLVDYFCVSSASNGYLAVITDGGSGTIYITKQ